MKKLTYLAGWWFNARLRGIKRPLQTCIYVSDLCNLKCKHCAIYARGEANTKTFEKVCEELTMAYNDGTRFVDFQGGEPTLWKDGDKTLNDLIRHAKKVGYYSCTVTTNATRPFPGLECDSIWVSLDGIGEFHDWVRGEGAFEKLLANVESCGHKALSVNMVVNSHNYTAVEDTIRFAKEHPVIQSISINFHTPNEETQYLFLDWPIRNQVIDKVLEMKRQGYPVMNSSSGLNYMRGNEFEKPCWISSFIWADGTYYKYCPGYDRNACERCGFAIAGEMKSVFEFNIDTILAGLKLRVRN